MLGRMSAPQNLQRTRSRLFFEGITWSLLHFRHVRLRPRIAPITVDIKKGFMSFHSLYLKVKICQLLLIFFQKIQGRKADHRSEEACLHPGLKLSVSSVELPLRRFHNVLLILSGQELSQLRMILARSGTY